VNFLQFLDAAHISRVNSNKMAGDRPRQPQIKFSAYADFSSPIADQLGLKMPNEKVGVKDGYS